MIDEVRIREQIWKDVVEESDVAERYYGQDRFRIHEAVYKTAQIIAWVQGEYNYELSSGERLAVFESVYYLLYKDKE